MIDKSKCWLKKECQNCPEGTCVKLFKLDYLYTQAEVPLRLRKHIPLVTDPDGTDVKEFGILKNIQDNIMTFIEDGRQLYIHSAICGCGKTSWSTRLLQTYFNNIWQGSALRCRALFINVPNFLFALKDNISEKSDYIQKIKKNALSCDLIIWDDIGNKLGTEFEINSLLSIIDGRINNGKANIFTSNLNDAELHLALGDRLASRICNIDYNIELKGKDKRSLTFEKEI